MDDTTDHFSTLISAYSILLLLTVHTVFYFVRSNLIFFLFILANR